MTKKKYYYSRRYWLTFEYGPLILIAEPKRLTTYDADWFEHNEVIDSPTMNDYVSNYDFNHLIERGVGWDEKWYKDASYTTEVTTPYVVSNNATFYANLYRVIRFNVLDTQTREPITPTSLTLDGVEITNIAHPTYSDYVYVIKAPHDSTTQTFTIAVTAEGYEDVTLTYSLDTLDTRDILLTKKQEVDDFNINIQWDAPRHDFDAHLFIYNNGQTDGEAAAHLYYRSNKPSGYQGNASDAIEYPKGLTPRNYYTLDYDDDTQSGGTQKNHTENVSGKLISGLTYKFAVHDFENGDKIKEQNCVMTLTMGGTVRRFIPINTTTDNRWEVLTISESSTNVWDITLGSNTEEVLTEPTSTTS